MVSIMNSETEIYGELCYLTNETLEGELANQEIGGLLVATNFTEGNGNGEAS